MTQLVRRENKDGVAIIPLNRPERHNAIDDEMGEALRDALDVALTDEDARVILLRGEGKSFCSGRDTNVLGHRARDESDFHFVRRAQDGRLKLMDNIDVIETVHDIVIVGPLLWRDAGVAVTGWSRLRVADDDTQ